MVHIFIINQFAGNKKFAKEIRAHLSKKTNFRYFVFNSVRVGFEKELTQKIIRYFENEKLRFYCCGGSGTMRNIIDSIENLSDVEIAFFPCGLTNDFLKMFDDISLFRNLDNLINGKVVEIDYIKSNYGIALNTLSVGYDSNIENAMKKYRVYDIFSPLVPYIMSVIKGIIFAKAKNLEVVIDGVQSSRKYEEIVFGNGAVLGGNLFFAEHANIQDGMASYLTILNINFLETVTILSKVMNKKLKKLGKKARYGECKTIEIRSLDGKPIAVNFDGELVNCGTECKAEIVEKGLKFVIPEGIEIKDYNLY